VYNVDLSIVIVNYNTKELLKQTIESIIKTSSGFDYEIIVVDNSSRDNSVEMVRENFESVILIANSSNLGYAKANNMGINKAAGRYVLLLNSDTIVLEDCLQACVKYMDNNKNIGALGCKVVLRNGELDHACKRGFPTPEASLYYLLKLDKLFPNSKRFGQYDLTYLPQDEINEVDVLIGAFMMVRKQTIDEIGLLDEDFFMYGEDIDWCYRIKAAGFINVYYPKQKIIHYKGASSRKRRFMTIYEFHRAMLLFYNKHYLHKYNFLVTLTVYAGVALKLGFSIFINLFKRRG
jgi:GT2 family glycosyltransferase